jgi:WD40 repeat protein/DNA-binding SARP family transcriptional activator/tRNA A-37 threonylcarbamoyl transferase component Bud32
MTVLTLETLGPFRAFLGQTPLTDFRTRKVQALLIYLATEPRPQRRELLMDLLWPGMPERSARSNLRQVLYYLRQLLPEVSSDGGNGLAPVIANRQHIQLNPQAGARVDTQQLEALLARAHSHEHLDLSLCQDCAQHLEEAVSLYRGDFLADFYLDDSGAYEEWAQARREYYRRQVLDALAILTTMALRRREFAAAERYAAQQVDLDNLRESGYRQLMEALALSGRREQALAVYEACRRVLAEELGMGPAARTTAYYDQIVAGELQFDRLPAHGVRGYELKEPIDEGSYGVLYRALQPAVMREVAIKVIRRQYADNPDFIRRFEAEAQTIARLEHPHIVPLYDYWRDPDGAYLVMRYLRGGSLLAALQTGPWRLERAAAMLEQVAGALSAAHRMGVVHRDIKPGNILLDEAGNACVADFGIAMSSGPQITPEGAVASTLDYVSPEQILGEPVTPQTDVYSLGAVLYETLTGEKPFAGVPVARLLYSQLHEPIPLVAASRPDIPAPVDAILQKATAKQPSARYATALEMAAAFRGAIGEEERLSPAGPREGLAAPLEVVNPYKGLNAFQEADAEHFFGREALVQQLVARLAPAANGQDSRFLAVVGPSGSGKSSVVNAGLIPALRQGALPGSANWFITEMVPGTNPLEELEQALWRVAVDPPPDLVAPMQRDSRGILRTIRRVLPAEPPDGHPQLLLIIDQFEELFTLVEDESQRVFFLDSLLAALAAPRSPLRLVVTLRADFYDRPLQYQEWGQLFKDNSEVVLPLNSAELAWAVREPARTMGVRLEDGLEATIVSTVADQPGALPLLQYALTELFERREGRLISRAAYERLGGVQGALGQRAEGLYAGLPTSGQEMARQFFLRLVTLGEGSEDTRRRVLRAELEALTSRQAESDGGSQLVHDVLERFGAARFLTFDHDPVTRAPTVEVAHEALLREWPRLRGWLAESRDDLRQQRLLAQAAGEWQTAGRDPGYLLRHARLDQFADWTANTSVALTAGERAFVEASVAARESRLAAEEERRQRELHAARDLADAQQKRAEEQASAARRLRRRALYLAGALVVAAILAMLAAGASRRASANAAVAQTNADQAATSEAQAVANAELALNRQLEAESERQAAVAARSVAEHEALVRATAEAVAVDERETADQQRVLAEERLRLVASGELSLIAMNKIPSDPELSILLALQALENAQTKVAEEALHSALQASRVRMALVGHEEGVWGLAYSADGRQLATLDRSGTVRVWDLATGAELLSLSSVNGKDFNDFLYNKNGLELAVLSSDESGEATINAWDTTSGVPTLNVTLRISPADWWEASLSPDFALLAVVYETGETVLWDTAQARPVVSFPAHGTRVWEARFNDDGTRLLVYSADGAVRIWDVPGSVIGNGPAAVTSFSVGEDAQVTASAFSDDGTRVALGFSRSQLQIWELSSVPVLRHSLEANQANIFESLDFNGDGSLLAGATLDATVTVWETGEGRPLYKLVGHTSKVSEVVFSPDGRTLATASSDGSARIWDAAPVAGGEMSHFATEGNIWDLELSPDGQLLAVGGLSGPAALLDAKTGERLLELAGEPTSGVYRVSFHPAGDRVATVGQDNTIRIWDLQSGEVVLAWTGHGEGISGGLFFGTLDVAYSPDGSRLATAGADGLAKVWDAATGAELLMLAGHTDGLHSIAYSPDGRWIATSSDEKDTSVKVWDANSGEELYTLEGHPVRVWALAFSPDSSFLATGGFLGVVKLWDLASGKELYTLPSQVNTAVMMAFSPDGTKLITGGESLRVWDVATGTEQLTLSDQRSHLAISPDGRRLYASRVPDGVVRVYVLQLEDAVALARERLTRWWTPQECRQYLHQDECPER